MPLDEEGRQRALDRLLVSAQDGDGFDRITALVRSVMNAPVAAVSLVDRDCQWFKSIDGMNISKTSREAAFCARTIMGTDPLAVEDAAQHPGFAANPLVTGEPRIRSYLGAPLMTSEGYNVGALCVIGFQPRRFSANDRQILSGFASLVVRELELRQLADLDPLTGLPNRRCVIDRLDSLATDATRTGCPMSLAYVDLDHFKKINDTYGHPAGDEVLRKVARNIAANVRGNEFAGRIGGEEFAVVMADCTADAARIAAERLRRSISDARIGSDGLSVTASIGVAELPGNRQIGPWMAAADAALYRAKQNGRNRVELAAARLIA